MAAPQRGQCQREELSAGALHDEHQAIEDALKTLHFLEHEENHFVAEEKRRALEYAVQRLQSLSPKIKTPNDKK